jgi:hypothetical protein
MSNQRDFLLTQKEEWPINIIHCLGDLAWHAGIFLLSSDVYVGFFPIQEVSMKHNGVLRFSVLISALFLCLGSSLGLAEQTPEEQAAHRLDMALVHLKEAARALLRDGANIALAASVDGLPEITRPGGDIPPPRDPKENEDGNVDSTRCESGAPTISGEDNLLAQLKKLDTEALVERIASGEIECVVAAEALGTRMSETRDPLQRLELQRMILRAVDASSSVDGRVALLISLNLGSTSYVLDESILVELRERCLQWHPCRKLQYSAAQTMAGMCSNEKLSSEFIDDTIRVLDDGLSSAPHTVMNVTLPLLHALVASQGVPSTASTGRLLRLYTLLPSANDMVLRRDIVKLLACVEKTEEAYQALDYIARTEADAKVRESAQKLLENWNK